MLRLTVPLSFKVISWWWEQWRTQTWASYWKNWGNKQDNREVWGDFCDWVCETSDSQRTQNWLGSSRRDNFRIDGIQVGAEELPVDNFLLITPCFFWASSDSKELDSLHSLSVSITLLKVSPRSSTHFTCHYWLFQPPVATLSSVSSWWMFSQSNKCEAKFVT